MKKGISRIKLLKKNMIIQCVKDHVLYGSEDHIVWKSTNNGKTWKRVCALYPGSDSFSGRIKDKILRSSLARTFRRNVGIHNVVVLNSGAVIVQYDKIYRWDNNSYYARPVFDLERNGIFGPLKNGLAYDPVHDAIYFGEYVIDRPKEVRICRGLNDGRTWDVCYKFSIGRIRHIHSIVPDNYRKRIWICTGDNNYESGLFYTDDQFNSVHLFKGGDQSWRMVSLIPLENSIIWGSDAGQDAPEDATNFIYMWDFKENKKKQLCCIDNPAYYSIKLADGSMAISTTYEPLIKKKSKSEAVIWISDNGLNWKKHAVFPYEFKKRKTGTKYATIQFPISDASNSDLYCSPLNVVNFDFCILKIDRWIE